MRNIKPEKKDVPMINARIRFPKMQVISAEGQNLGILSRHEALQIAADAGSDLVLLAEKGGHGYPVAKVMDYGKSLYEKKKKQTEAKKHQKVIQVKEIKLRPKIGAHDLATKIKQAAEFLKKGKHLKVTIFFRGREMVTKEERGALLFDRVHSLLEEYGVSQQLIYDKDMKSGPFWSRVYHLKTK